MIQQQEPENGSNKSKPSALGRIGRRLIFLPLLAIAGLYFLSMTSAKPDNLGATDGRLAKCPDSPNCVSSQVDDPSQLMAPISFTCTGAEKLAEIKLLIESDFKRAVLKRETDDYLQYEFSSLIFRFVDDVEFLVDDKNQVINFRSASRVGHSDMGANRKRMKQICESLNQ